LSDIDMLEPGISLRLTSAPFKYLFKNNYFTFKISITIHYITCLITVILGY